MAPGIPELEGVEHRFVEASGVRFHVAEAGSGPPLLCVHGWPQHWWVWRKLIPELAQSHRVICPDLRGFGWSDAPPGDYAKEELAGDLLALMDALEVERASVIGHDWGGFASFLAALRAPERIEGLVVMNIIHPWFDPPPITPRALALASYQFVLSTPGVGTGALRHTGLVRTILQKGAHPDYRRSPEELSIFADTFKDPDKARATSALYRTFLTKELRAIGNGAYAEHRLTVPTLLLTGEADRVVTPDRIDGYQDHADSMSTAVVPGSGHFTPEEQPEAVLEHVRDHLGG